MNAIKLRHLSVMFALAAATAACANRCTEPAPAALYQNETGAQRLVRERQDSADFAALELEKAYERMSGNERMGGVVYE